MNAAKLHQHLSTAHAILIHLAALVEMFQANLLAASLEQDR